MTAWMMSANVAALAGAPAWLEFFQFGSVNVRTVTLGCMVIGLSAGVLGCFAFLRRRSLLGDALAHAALPGVCVAFILTGTRNPLVIMLGAVVACWLGAVSIDAITRYTRCKEESALGMVLSVFFGVGILLLTHIQHTGGAAQAGLERFLFGQAAAMQPDDLGVLSVASVLMLAATAVGYRHFKLASFDPEFMEALNLRRRWASLAMATLLVLAVAIGLQAVGVVLMAAMLVTPAAAARYWTHHLSVMLALAGVFGAISGAIGAYISYLQAGMPTGPWMVVAVSVIFGVSVLFAPRQGLVARGLRTRRFRRRTAEENLLRTLYRLGEDHKDWEQGYTPAELIQYRPMDTAVLLRIMGRLEHQGLVYEPEKGVFQLTAQGLERAARLTRLHRLWELYLTQKLHLPADHVHADAEEIEHILTPELEAHLVASLEEPARDPHARTIPEDSDKSAEAVSRLYESGASGEEE
ncbi:MAG: metal ABC transporter permease [Candidatus Hydrogenedentota bacterium]